MVPNGSPHPHGGPDAAMLSLISYLISGMVRENRTVTRSFDP
jgi:hypothetical protein